MAVPHARKLACSIIKDQLGEEVERVVECLLRRGPGLGMGLPEVMRGTALEMATLRNCLLVLVQHNCVQPFSLAPPEDSGPVPSLPVLYLPLLDAILQRLRFPKFILTARDTLGDEAADIVEAFAENGRLSFSQIVERTASRNPQKSLEAVRTDLVAAMASLVGDRMLERVGPPRPVVLTRSASSEAMAKTGGGSRARARARPLMEASGYFGSEEERISSAGRSPETERFRVPDFLISSDQKAAGASDGVGLGRPPGTPAAPSGAAAQQLRREGPGSPLQETKKGKRKKAQAGAEEAKGAAAARGAAGRAGLGALLEESGPTLLGGVSIEESGPTLLGGVSIEESGPGRGLEGEQAQQPLEQGGGASLAGAPVDEEVSLQWRINCEEFLRRFRHQEIVKFIAETVDPAAGVVAAAMLQVGKPQEVSLKNPYSASLSLESIAHAVRHSPDGRSMAMTTERIRSSLQALVLHPGGLANRSTDSLGGGHYMLLTGKIIELVKLREIEAVISQRFGSAACRIFRLLQQKKCLEQKQIAELAMIPLADARQLLCRLLLEEYVHLQEVPKTADHAPQRTFYLWRVSATKAGLRVLDHMCKAALNLRLRLEHEMDKEHEVLSLLESIQEGGGSDGRKGPGAPAAADKQLSLTTGQRGQLERIRRVAAILETSLLRLDHAIMLFSSF